MKAAVFIRLKIEIKPERTVCGWSFLYYKISISKTQRRSIWKNT